MNNYVTFKTKATDITPDKLYLVNQRGKFLDDVGDERDLNGRRDEVATEGTIEYIIRCIEAPNLSCKGKFISKQPDYNTGYIACSAEHKAAAHRFTLDEVAEFLRFTHKCYHENKRSSAFEVLLAPIRVVAEPPKPKRGNGGHEVGTILCCRVSDRREIVVGQHYRVASIDSDGDEWIVPVNTHEHTHRQMRRFPVLASNPEFARATVFTVSN